MAVTVDQLPPDIFILIISFCQISDISSIARVNKYFLRFTETDSGLWRILCQFTELNSYDIDPKLSWKENFKQSRGWKFDNGIANKSELLHLSPDRLTVTRPGDFGNNPSVRTTKTFSKYRNYFEVLVNSAGHWIRLGMASKNIELQDALLLGDQSVYSNLGVSGLGGVSYYDQRHQYENSGGFGDGQVVSFYWNHAKKVIEISVDGSKIATINTSYEMDKIYPTVSISYKGEVTIFQLKLGPSVLSIFFRASIDGI